MYLELTGTQVIVILCSIGIICFLCLPYLKKWSMKKHGLPTQTKPIGAQSSVARLGIGMVCSLLVALVCISWTTHEVAMEYTSDVGEMFEEIEVEPPVTDHPPPPLPPPPPPIIEEVAEELVEDEPDFLDQDVEEETVVQPVKQTSTVAPPPPPPPVPPKPVSTAPTIFRIVEQMPRFPGCEAIAGTHKEKKACADKEMLSFIYDHVQYPRVARDNGISGTVVISFVVDKQGGIRDIRVIRDPGGGLGDEAVRVVEMMSALPERWTPGKQRKRPVDVEFTLPVKFKLN